MEYEGKHGHWASQGVREKQSGGNLRQLVGRSCKRRFELVWRTILEGAPPFLLALGVFLETLGPHDWAAAGCCCYSLTHQYV